MHPTSKITKWLDQIEAMLAPPRMTVVGCDAAECQEQVAAKRAAGEIAVDDEVFMICTGVPRSPGFLSRPDPKLAAIGPADH